MTKDEVIEMINASSCSPSEKWKLATAVDRLPDAAIAPNPCSTLREALEQKLNRVNAVLRSETASNFDKVRAEKRFNSISHVMEFIDEL